MLNLTFIKQAAFILLIISIGSIFAHNCLPTGVKKTELIAYVTSYDLFRKGENPYDYSNALSAQKKLNPGTIQASMVWNPPMFFSTIGLLFEISTDNIEILFIILSIASSLWLSYFGFLFSKSREINLLMWVSCAFLNVPLLTQITIGQLSSWVYAMVSVGFYLIIRRKNFLGGSFLTFGLLKPHLFLFPFTVLLIDILKKRNYSVIFGGILATVVFSVFSEIRYPGIHSLWLFRESWPLDFMGSTITSLLRIVFKIRSFKTVELISISSVILGFFCIWLYYRRFPKYDIKDLIMFSFCINCIFTPYGYVFDQIILIAVLNYILHTFTGAESEDPTPSRKIILFLLLTHFLILLLSSGESVLYWYFLPPASLFLFLRLRHPKLNT